MKKVNDETAKALEAVAGNKVSEAASEYEEEVKLQRVSKKILNGRRYEREWVLGNIREGKKMAETGMFDMGKWLIVHKANTEHGQYEKDVQEIAQLEPRVARRIVARTMLIANRTALSDLNPSKLDLLNPVPEEELNSIEVDGTLYGKEVDKWAAMTWRQMRDELKKYRKRSEKKEKYAEKLEEDNERLQIELEKAKEDKLPQDDIAIRKEVQKLRIDLQTYTFNIRRLAEQIANAEQGKYSHAAEADVAGLALLSMAEVHQLHSDIGTLLPAALETATPDPEFWGSVPIPGVAGEPLESYIEGETEDPREGEVN